MSEPLSPWVVVLESNRRVGRRIARVMASAVGLGRVACVDQANELSGVVGSDTRIIACGERQIEQVAQWDGSAYPELRFLVWISDRAEQVIHLARALPAMSNFIGWPSFHSMPRAWELAMVTRRLIDPYEPPPSIMDLLRWGATAMEWTPGSTIDRDVAVAEISQLVFELCDMPRVADRVAELVHELLMNAMYDAPRDGQGRPRYALDRRQDIVLGELERPTLRLATDGMLMAVEVTDPFGALEREHVMSGVARGLAAVGSSDTSAIIDTSHGGAGLGMAKLYMGSAGLIVDVQPGLSTTVTSLHDLDISPREMRSMPGSLHYFGRWPAVA